LYKKSFQEEIKQLLANNPQIKLEKTEENWEESLNQLNSFHSVNEYARQIKKLIKAQEQKSNEKIYSSLQDARDKKNNSNLIPLIIAGLFIGGVLVVSLIIIKKKRKIKRK
jgi:hypothetical protein